MKPTLSPARRAIAFLLASLLLMTAMSLLVPAEDEENSRYDRFADAGQLTHTVRATTTPITLDGKISDGEWNADPIEVKIGNPGVAWMDWTTAGFPQDELTEIIPFRILYYVTYNASGLYVGAEITEPSHYCPDDSMTNLWTYDCLEVDVSLDAYGDRAKDLFTENEMLDRSRCTYALVDNGEDAPYGLGYCYTASSYGALAITNQPLYEDTYGIAREEQTTTYEIFYAWEDLYDEAKPIDEVYINFQLHIADMRYGEYCNPEYGYCVGGIRYAVVPDDDMKATYNTEAQMVMHIFKLEGDGEADATETESASESVSITETESAANAPTESVTEAMTATPTDTDSAADTASGTNASASDGGCSSALGAGGLCLLAVVTVAAGAIGRRKKQK